MNHVKFIFQSCIALVVFTCSICFAAMPEIPLHLSFSPQGMPATTIQIQGKTIPLAFDISSTRTNIALSADIIKKLNLQLAPSNEKFCSHDIAGHETCYKTFTIPEVNLGTLAMRNVPGVVRDYMWNNPPDSGFIFTEAYQNGVIGQDLLRKFNVLIDYPREQVVLMPQGQYPKEYNVKSWQRILFTVNRYGITTSAKINGIDVVFAWMTAANHSVLTTAAMQKIFHVKQARFGKTTCVALAPDSVVIANKKFPSTPFYPADEEFPFDGLIGSTFFQEHAVFFDFKNNYLYVKN
jgi:hypothetical protein